MTLAILIEAILLGAALAMDAMAASVALGAAGRLEFNWKKIVITAGFFGFFQFSMPLIGFIGSGFAEEAVAQYGKWIAGILLMGIGGKMFFDRNDSEAHKFSLQKVTVLAFATSIDALLVGVGFRCLHRTSILPEIIIIGVITALISAGGCLLGRWSGRMLGNHCSILGAAVLIMLGIKIIIFN